MTALPSPPLAVQPLPYSAFYKLLDEITAECEELMAAGVGGTGVGFDGPSCGRLGSHGWIATHNPEPHRLRDVALQVGCGQLVLHAHEGKHGQACWLGLGLRHLEPQLHNLVCSLGSAD